MSTLTDATPVGVNPRPRFLLVIADSDNGAARELAAQLAVHDVDAELCVDAADALLAAGHLRPDGVLVSAQQKGLSSIDLVRAMSRRAGIPVVVGVGGADAPDAAAVLAAGATACVARPYRLPELIPIMRSIRPDAVGTLDPPIESGRLYLDAATVEVRLGGRSISLPMREFELLRFLMHHVHRVVSREEIYQNVWGGQDTAASNTVTVHIKRLRAHLGDDQKRPRIIVTVRGVGYRLVPPTRQIEEKVN